MTDIKKAIKGLEEVDAYFHRMTEVCYRGDEATFCDLKEKVADAITMLKEQEAEAKWIYGEDETGVDGWYCSECNFFEPWFYEFTEDIDFIRFYGHCPKCGRRMTSYTGKSTQERR